MGNFRNFKKSDKVKKIPTALRLREDVHNIMTFLIKNTGISKVDFIELAIIEHCISFDTELKYQKIDFKKFLEVLKFEKLRKYQAKIRSSILSRALFLNRVRIDLIKLTTLRASKKDIVEYLKERKIEASLYPQSEELIINYENYVKQSDFKISEFRKVIKQEISEIKVVEHETNIHLE